MISQKSEWFAWPPSVVADGALLVGGQDLEVREDLLDGAVGPLGALERRVGLVHVGLVVLVVVELHRRLVDRRLERVVGVRELREPRTACALLFGEGYSDGDQFEQARGVGGRGRLVLVAEVAVDLDPLGEQRADLGGQRGQVGVGRTAARGSAGSERPRRPRARRREPLRPRRAAPAPRGRPRTRGGSRARAAATRTQPRSMARNASSRFIGTFTRIGPEPVAERAPRRRGTRRPAARVPRAVTTRLIVTAKRKPGGVSAAQRAYCSGAVIR